MQGFDNTIQAEFLSNNPWILFIGSCIWCGQGWDINGISYWLIARRIDHIPQSLFGILYAASFWISVPEKYKFLLLTCPQPPYAFTIHLQISSDKRYCCKYQKQKKQYFCVCNKVIAALTLITRKLRYLLLSIIILYSSEPSSNTCLQKPKPRRDLTWIFF